VIELDPGNAQAWNKLGDLHFSSGTNEEALHSYQKAIVSDQDYSVSYGNLASIYVQKGCHAEAIPLLQKGIELSDDTRDTVCLWNRLGDAYRHLDDYEHAMAAYRNADALDPQKASAQPESVPAEVDPQFTPSEDLFVQPVMNFKLRCMQEQAMQPEPPEPAVIGASDSLPTMDDNPTIPGEPKAEILNWLDGLGTFMTSFHQHGMTGPTGAIPAAAGEPDEIKETLEMQFVQPETAYPVFTKDEPTQPSKEETVCWDEPWKMFQDTQPSPDPDISARGEPETTSPPEPASQTGPAIEEENAHLWNELGSIYFNTGAYDEAINAFKKAIELDRSYGWSYNNLAALYSRQGRYKDAIPMYQKGLQYVGDAKDKALLWNRLGDVYRRLNEHDRAAAAYRKAMELDPDNVSLLTRARFSLLGNCRA
jgi:tetratricopeptide (TPR) repeat protein